MVRFLADASLHHAIVTGCVRREPAIDFLSAQNAKLDGKSDPDVLEIAASQGRILVTHDVRTMPKHFAEWRLPLWRLLTLPRRRIAECRVSIGHATS